MAESYAIGSVSRGRYFQFDFERGEARLLCLHSETGALIWEYRYASEYDDLYGYNRGPRCSPVVDGPRVYIYGVEGQLHCLRVSDGSLIWQVDTVRQFGVVQNFFGVGSTPIIYDDLLIVMVGGSPAEDQQIPPGQLDRVTGNGSAIVAFDKQTGQVRYRLSDELASYASPRLASWDGRPWCFAFLRGGLLCFHPRDATIDFHVPWRAALLESVNASTPVVVDNQVFISEAYGPGGLLLEFRREGVRQIWSDQERRRDQAMRTHWNTPIYHEGFLYGSSGRHSREAELRCVRWEDGKVMWSHLDLTRASLLYVDGHFVCLGEDGILRLIRANPERFEQIAVLNPENATQPDQSSPSVPMLRYPAWAAPILSHGLLYARGRDRVICLELIPDQQ